MALALALIAVSPAPTFAQVAGSALPTNGQIVGGAGSISQSGSKLTVNQTSDRLIAKWQTFNIGKDALVTHCGFDDQKHTDAQGDEN